MSILILAAVASITSGPVDKDMNIYLKSLAAMPGIQSLVYHDSPNSCIISKEISEKEKIDFCTSSIVGNFFNKLKMYQFVTRDHKHDIFLTGDMVGTVNDNSTSFKIDTVTLDSIRYKVKGSCYEITDSYGICRVHGENINLSIGYSIKETLKEK